VSCSIPISNPPKKREFPLRMKVKRLGGFLVWKILAFSSGVKYTWVVICACIYAGSPYDIYGYYSFFGYFDRVSLGFLFP